MSSEQVPSWAVTADQLAGWGFPVRKTDKVVGSKVTVAEGLTFGQAVHAAWAAGHVRMAAIPDDVAEAAHAAGRQRIADMQQAARDNVAFLRKHNMIVGPSFAK